MSSLNPDLIHSCSQASSTPILLKSLGSSRSWMSSLALSESRSHRFLHSSFLNSTNVSEDSQSESNVSVSRYFQLIRGNSPISIVKIVAPSEKASARKMSYSSSLGRSRTSGAMYGKVPFCLLHSPLPLYAFIAEPKSASFALNQPSSKMFSSLTSRCAISF